jgi:uncharacterized protein
VTGPLPRAKAAALALAALLAAPARAEVPVPALTGPVVDQAGLLPGGEVQRLERLARAARAEKGGAGVQLQFLLVPSLEGESIEDYSMRVAEAWKLGSRASDNGVLVTVSRDDRRVRIEVGGGLEGGLTDAQSARIIRETMVPAFRERRYGEGLYGAGVQILGALGSLPRDVAPAARTRPGVHLSSLGIAAFVIFFLILRIFTGFGMRRRRSLWGLPWGGGGLGGGSWGGGGGGGSWGGGGGGFSGGGSSGGW